MIRNEDIVEDFVPIEHYSMHAFPNNNNNNGNELGINHQIVDNCNEQQNCETIVANNISESHMNSMGVNHEIGFYGWRKKGLYF